MVISPETKVRRPFPYKLNKAGCYGYRHFLFHASSDAIFYLHISKEPIELFRIMILTFENEARSEEL
jgi:hypothetical protein